MGDNPRHGISYTLLQDLLASERELRRIAEAYAGRQRQALIAFVRDALPEVLEELGHEHPDAVEEATPEQLFARAGVHVARLRQQGGPIQTGQVQQLRQALAAAAAQCEQRLARYREANEALEAQLADCRGPQQGKEGEPAGLPPDFQPHVPPDAAPGWFQEWTQAANFLRGADYLRILGQTGAPLRSEVNQRWCEHWKINPSSGTVGRLVTALSKDGLVQLVKTPLTKSVAAHFIYLSERGVDAYRLLFGADPVEQEAPRLLKRHDNPEHAYLILETQSFLEQAGYRVDRYPEPVDLGELGICHPDLAADYGERHIYIEVERDAHKKEGSGERRRKWARVLELCGGELYVATDSDQQAKKLISEVKLYAGLLPRAGHLHLIVTESLRYKRQSDLPQGWEIWSPVVTLP
jgi:hypothetical protein